MKKNFLIRWFFLLSFIPALVLADSGVTIPNLRLYSDAVSADIASTATGKGAALIGYMPAGAGSVAATVQAKLGEIVSVKDKGAVGNGVADDTAAIQAAINSFSSGSGTVYFPPGIYKVTSKITVAQNRIHLIGAGGYSTEILFAPTANGTCLELSKGVSVIYQGSVKGMAFYSTDSTFSKVAIDLIDSSGYVLEDIVIGGSVVVGGSTFWAGASSIGIRTKGREFGSVRNIYAYADKPLVIADNPNSTIDIDHFHFENLYLGANRNPNVTIDTGVNLTHVTFDGANPWVLGTHSFYWNDTTSTGTSYGLTIKNLRTEQGTSATSFSIYISHNYNLLNLNLENCQLDSARKGIYLRKVRQVTHDSVNYGSTSLVAYDAVTTDTNAQLTFRNSAFSPGSTATLTGYQQVWAVAQPASGSPIPPNATYQYAYADARRSHYEYGARIEHFTGTLANGANIDLYCGTANGAVAAFIDVVAYDSVTPRNLGGSAISTANNNVLIAGTANFNVGNVAGSLTVMKKGGQVILFNQSGQTVSYVVRVMWM